MSTIEAPTYVPRTDTGYGRPPRRIVLGIMMVLVFLSGGVIGSGSALMLVNNRIKEDEKPRDPGPWSEKIVSELQGELSLSKEQTAQVDQIMKDHLAALVRLRREVFFVEIRKQFKQMEDQVDSVLDEQQSVQWHAWLEERRKRVCPTSGRGHNGSGRAAKEAGAGAAGSEKQRDATVKADAKPEGSSDPTP